MSLCGGVRLRQHRQVTGWVRTDCHHALVLVSVMAVAVPSCGRCHTTLKAVAGDSHAADGSMTTTLKAVAGDSQATDGSMTMTQAMDATLRIAEGSSVTMTHSQLDGSMTTSSCTTMAGRL